MGSAVFSTKTESYQVSQIIYVGPVTEIPSERRRNGSTHSFKIITSAGAAFCYFESQEAAQKSRSYLGNQIEAIKTKCIKHGNEIIDPLSIISFSNVVKFKNEQNGYTHAVILTLQTMELNNSKVFLKYHSEENAVKGRKALYAIIHSVHGMSAKKEIPAEGEAVDEKQQLPF